MKLNLYQLGPSAPCALRHTIDPLAEPILGVYTHNVKSSPDVGLNRYLENECLFAVKKLVWARLAGRTLERAGRSGNGKLVEAHDRITVPGRWNRSEER